MFFTFFTINKQKDRYFRVSVFINALECCLFQSKLSVVIGIGFVASYGVEKHIRKVDFHSVFAELRLDFFDNK